MHGSGTPVSYKEMLKVVKFALHTKDLGLKMYPNINYKAPLWELLLLSDSDHAGDKMSRLSISGFIMFLCGVPIMWRSKAQKTVALSSTEAEFYAVSEGVKEILFVVHVFFIWVSQ
jgi:hypothetical protein